MSDNRPAGLTPPTLDPDIESLLQRLLSEAQAVLGDHFAGMYVHGSVASGDFTPGRSDIDFVVVTTAELPAELLPALEAMHARLTASGLKWATHLEGSYIPEQALRCYDPAHNHHPALRVDGTFAVDGHGNDWIVQRYLIREKGLVLAGPEPKTLIDPIHPDDLRQAVLGTLQEWWAPQLQEPFRLYGREYQAYATLTMCRILYTLRHGDIASKAAAARWAQATLEEQWTDLIDRALAWPHEPQPDSLAETLDFIRYALQHSGHTS